MDDSWKIVWTAVAGVLAIAIGHVLLKFFIEPVVLPSDVARVSCFL